MNPTTHGVGMVNLIVVLVIAGLVLWAIPQLPLDATIRQIIRVLAIVIVVLFILAAFTGRHLLPGI